MSADAFFFLADSAADPAENLALEELLLQPYVRDPLAPAILRLWENIRPAVVLGRGDRAAERVRLDRAAARGIPVLRRVSGGGPVVHGPGNLNISFFLPYWLHPDLGNLRASYRLILGWVQDAMEATTGRRPEHPEGSDLALQGRKIAGSAQARRRHGLLHHMTLLVDMDLDLVDELLKAPDRAPDYRAGRAHGDFITTLRREGLAFDRRRFLETLLGRWEHRPYMLAGETRAEAARLATAKYADPGWNLER